MSVQPMYLYYGRGSLLDLCDLRHLDGIVLVSYEKTWLIVFTRLYRNVLQMLPG